MVGLGAVLALAGSASDLEAQTANAGEVRQVEGDLSDWPQRSSLIFDLSIGLLTPLGNLTADQQASDVTEITPGLRLSTGVVLAGSATLFLNPKLGLAIHGSWAGAEVDQKALPDGGSGDQRLGDADYVTATVNVVYRLLERPIGALDPYISAGAGVRHISFSFEDPQIEDATDPMVTLAAGMRAFLLGRIHWTLDVRDAISMFEATDGESRLQNDLLVTVGFGARL
ncbi:MAG: hypothetical protein PVI01_05115 [Gemmatimonadales bacterium]|jgi:hypothetical protein